MERANRRGQGEGRVGNRTSKTKIPGLGLVFNNFHLWWPRLAGRFEGCANTMVWPWRQERQRDYAGAPRRYIPYLAPVGWGRYNHRHPASSRRPNRYNSAFWLQWHHSGGSSRHNHIRTFTLRSHMTRSFLLPGSHLASRSGVCLFSIRVVCKAAAPGWAPRLSHPHLLIPLSLPFRFETPGD